MISGYIIDLLINCSLTRVLVTKYQFWCQQHMLKDYLTQICGWQFLEEEPNAKMWILFPFWKTGAKEYLLLDIKDNVIFVLHLSKNDLLKPFVLQLSRILHGRDIVTPFGDICLGQHWFRYCCVWRHQADTWSNVVLILVHKKYTRYATKNNQFK